MRNTYVLLVSFLLFFTLLFINSCREKELRDIDFQNKPLHCFNGMLDSNELITDAGGACGCDATKMLGDCLLKKNQILIESRQFTLNEINRELTPDSLLKIDYQFDKIGELSLLFNKKVQFNVNLETTNNLIKDNTSIIIKFLYKPYGNNNVKVYSSNIQIFYDGCNTHLITCNGFFEHPFYMFPIKRVDCNLNIELKLN